MPKYQLWLDTVTCEGHIWRKGKTPPTYGEDLLVYEFEAHRAEANHVYERWQAASFPRQWPPPKREDPNWLSQDCWQCGQRIGATAFMANLPGERGRVAACCSTECQAASEVRDGVERSKA
ncbi:MAG: hypothetical protein ACPGVG_18135 [Mycobacterium sp.]